MSIGIRFYSVGKLTKQRISELLKIHLKKNF